jgi:uncharacterized protein
VITGAAPRAFHVMSKPTGAICNLDCEYCFFLSKEELYPGSGFRMDPAVHEAYIRQLLAAQRGLDEIVVAFQGGEPTLMGLDFFRRTLELERAYASPGQRVLNTIQTNATLVDDEWAEFFRENDFLVGVSIDGPGEMHDAYRVDKGGKPTFDRAIRGLDALKRHDVNWNAITTPTGWAWTRLGCASKPAPAGTPSPSSTTATCTPATTTSSPTTCSATSPKA